MLSHVPCEIVHRPQGLFCDSGSYETVTYRPRLHTHLCPNRSYNMPLAPVNDEGVVLYYHDTGVPGNRTDYVTLIIIHGTIFHGGKLPCLTICL